MQSLVYTCHYDGKECDEVIPQVDEDGVVKHVDWRKICENCDRNFSLGRCYGCLKIKED